EGMERALRSRTRVQHGRMVRCPGEYLAFYAFGGLSVRDGACVLRSAGFAYNSGQAAPFRVENGAANLCQTDSSIEKARRPIGNRLWHWPRVPYRFLGTALRR